MSLDDGELAEFGRRADRDEQPLIAVGGFIDLGLNSTAQLRPGYEGVIQNADRQGQEAGSAAGTRQRPPAEAAPGEAAYPVDSGVATGLGWLQLDELYRYHPRARVWYGSPSSGSRMAIVHIPVGLFSTRSERAVVTLEVPLDVPRFPPLVNDVRAWARWADGTLILSHHIYPDRSLCACMAPDWLGGSRGDWVRGLDPLHELVGYCILWIAKVLHDHVYSRWPGPQHYPAAARLRRNRPDEYCGCGKRRLYRDCCMERDRRTPVGALVRAEARVRRDYLDALRARGRDPFPSYAAPGICP